jgi:hypothetical protein
MAFPGRLIENVVAVRVDEYAHLVERRDDVGQLLAADVVAVLGQRRPYLVGAPALGEPTHQGAEAAVAGLAVQ